MGSYPAIQMEGNWKQQYETITANGSITRAALWHFRYYSHEELNLARNESRNAQEES